MGSALGLVVLLVCPRLRLSRFTASRTRFFVKTSFRMFAIAEDLLFSTGSVISRNLRSSRLNQTSGKVTLLRSHLGALFRGEWSQMFILDYVDISSGDHRYPEIQELHICRLAQAVRSSDSPGILAAFDIKIQEYFAGKLPHAKNLVLGLFDLSTNNGIPPHQYSPESSSPGSSHPTIAPCFDVNRGSRIQLMDAIARSLTTGIFLDSMFYIGNPTELRPLFFCSSITPASFKKISGQCERDLFSTDFSENE